MNYKYHVKDETRMHIMLWNMSGMFQNMLAKKSRNEIKYLHSNILLLHYFTFEAYLNFLGQKVEPKIWKKEKEFFNKENFNGEKGTLGKFWFLAEKCKYNNDFEKGIEPYQFINRLSSIRDFFVHARPEIHETEIVWNNVGMPEQAENFLDKNVNGKNVDKSFKYVKDIIQKLHDQANTLYGYDSNIIEPFQTFERYQKGKEIKEP